MKCTNLELIASGSACNFGHEYRVDSGCGIMGPAQGSEAGGDGFIPSRNRLIVGMGPPHPLPFRPPGNGMGMRMDEAIPRTALGKPLGYMYMFWYMFRLDMNDVSSTLRVMSRSDKAVEKAPQVNAEGSVAS